MKVSPCAPARPPLLLTTAREIIEGDPVLLQDLQVHLSALRRQITEVHSPASRQLMATEIGCAEGVLRRFTVAGTDRARPAGLRAFAERQLAEVRRYIANGDFPEAAGYARNTLEHLAGELGPSTVVNRETAPQAAFERCLDAVRDYIADDDFPVIREAIGSLFEALTGGRPS